MKIVAGLLSVAMLGALAIGCGGDEEQGFTDAEIAAFDARFANPDGTLSGGNVASVISGAKDNQSSMAGANVTGNSQATGGSEGGSTIAKKSGDLSPLANSGSYCNALVSGQTQGSCECPNGGSFDYEIRGAGAGGGSASNTLMRIKMNACASGSSVIDGSEYLSMQSDTTDQRNPKFSMLFVINATITEGGKSKKVDAQMRYSNGLTEIAVRVDDGWVIVGTKSAGGTVTYTVRDRNGSWTCVYDGKGGTCTSGKGEKVSWGG